MPFADKASASVALQDPSLPPQELVGIAYRFPDLGSVVASHPAAYPELLVWLRSNGTPEARAAAEAVMQSRAMAAPPVTVQIAAQPAPPYYYQPTPRVPATLRPVSLVAVLVCMALWFAAPFLAVNIATLGSYGGQPTALQILTGDVTAIGDMTDSPAFWAAILSMIGVVICLVCVLARKNAAARVTAIVSDVALVLVLVVLLSALNGDAGLTEVAGIGYFGVLILFIVVAVASKSTRAAVNQAPPAYPLGAPYQAPISPMPLQAPLQPPTGPSQ